MTSGTEIRPPEKMSEFEAYQYNMGAMHDIVRRMKIIPELPSEAPNDVNPLTRVEFPEEGGVLTYMGGMAHPYKGFPFFEFVDKIDILKKTLRGMMSGLYHRLKKRSWWQLGRLALVPFLLGDLADAFVVMTHRHIDRFKIKPERYCTTVRELHRAMSVEFFDETPEERERRFMVRDIVCMFLECDNAYRFRFQDVIAELDKTKPAHKEVIRLFDIMTAREQTQEIKDSWKLVKYYLPWYLFFNPKLRKHLAAVFTELSIEKCTLDEGDKLFCEKRKDYKFGFMLCQATST